MQSSEVLTDLLPALCAARSAFPAIVRNCSAVARGGREYQYADLSAIADATSGILAQHGLVLVQAVDDGEHGQLCIRSTLYHTSGQWLACALSVPKPTSMQEVGSLSTYIRRYQQSSMLNIVTEDDDDGASTTGATTEPVATKAAAPMRANGHGTTSAPTERPTEGHITALSTLALTECGEEKEVFEQRIRQVMGLKPSASVAPKLLTRTMTMAQYMAVFEHYTRLQAQLARKTSEVTQAHHPTPSDAPAPAAAPTGEGPAAVPSGETSASAPANADATVDPAREALVRDAMGVGLPEAECRHIVAMHKDLAKAREILTAAARKRIQAA
jgi:hypothetical protein